MCELLETSALAELYQSSWVVGLAAAEQVMITVLPITTDIEDGDTVGGTEKKKTM